MNNTGDIKNPDVNLRACMSSSSRVICGTDRVTQGNSQYFTIDC